MDFFRKFFPSSKKNTNPDNNDSIPISKDASISLKNVPQVENNNPNIFETISPLNNIENTTKDECSLDKNDGQLDSNTRHSVEDLPCSEISRNDNKIDQILLESKVTNDNMAEIITLNEDDDERAINADTILEPCTVTYGPICKEITALINNTNETCILNTEDETLQSLKEFDEALSNFESSETFRTEFINLDDFYEIFNTLHNVNDDNSVIDPIDSETNNDETEKIEDAKIYMELNVASKITEDTDVISINSSTKDCESQTEDAKEIINLDDSDIYEIDSQSSECDGYNSSDFEFISEAEANLDGLIINFKGVNRQNSSHNIPEFCNDERINIDDVFDPCEGPSGQNGPRNEYEDRSYRDNHQIPLGDDYLALFQGIYNPVLPMSEIFFLENKSVRTSAMNSQYDGIGFVKQLAMRRHQPDSSEDEFADEAKECAKQILNTYPRENRKRRRRH